MSEPDNPPEPSSPAPRIPGLPLEERLAARPGGEASAAWAEAIMLTGNKTPEELQADAANREHDRSQRFKQHFETVAIVALWFASIAIGLVGAIWLWHMAAPAGWRWLRDEDVSHLQSIMTAGLLVGVIGSHFKKRMG